MAYFIACFSTQWVLLLFYWKHKDTSFKWKTTTEYQFFCYNNIKIPCIAKEVYQWKKEIIFLN